MSEARQGVASRPAPEVATLTVAPRLGGDAAAWDALVASSRLPSPFLRSWWLEAIAGPSSQFVLVHRGGRLVGGLALERTSIGPVGRLRLLGQGALAADHLDLVADPRHADEVVAVVGTWLRRRGTRIIDFEGMAADGHLARLLEGSRGRRSSEIVPFVELQTSDTDYLAQRPGALRSTITRGDRRFRKMGCVHESSTAGDMGTRIEHFLALHAARFGDASSLRASHDVLRRVLSAGAARGEARIHEMIRDGRVIACEVTFESCGRVSFYQSGRSERGDEGSAGTVLKWWVLQAARADGFAEYDLLRGDERYKVLWADAEREIVHVEIPIGVPAAFVCRAQSTARRMVRRVRAFSHRGRTAGEAR